MERLTVVTKSSKDYALLDSGQESKLERYGSVVLARPDPQALWEKGLSVEEWNKAAGRFEREGREGIWIGDKVPKEWQIAFGGLQFLIRPTSFKHTGLFPEQLSNWEWVQEILTQSTPELASQKSSAAPRLFVRQDSGSVEKKNLLQPSFTSMEPRILNLFGYTGGASLAAAKAGAHVTHVDASKTAVAWAKENAELSGLSDAPIRWIIEDALVFVKREIKRGVKYDGIIMDPPAFGHGPKNELWKIEEDFIEMMRICEELLSENPLFVLVNGYAAGYSSLAFAYNLSRFEKKFGGSIQYGDLAIAEEAPEARLLPCGIFARWARNPQ